MGYCPGLYHHPGLQGVAGGDVGQGPGSLEEHRIGLLLVRWGYAQKGHQFWNCKYSKINYGMGRGRHGLVKNSFFRSYYGATYLVNFCRKYLNRIDTGSMLKFRFSKKATKFETISHLIWRLLKGQIISECPLEISDFPKIPRKIWQISALESKKWSNQKIKALSYNIFDQICYLMYQRRCRVPYLMIWPLFRF